MFVQVVIAIAAGVVQGAQRDLATAAKDLAIASFPGLVGRFGLNEGTGTTTTSSSGGTVGTLTNGPLWIGGAPLTTNEAPTVTLTAPADASSIARHAFASLGDN